MRPTAGSCRDCARPWRRVCRRAHAAISVRRAETGARAIECCRTAALGGHLGRCDQCGHERNAYNSCADRHCPDVSLWPGSAKWLAKRQAELLECEYFHVVFTRSRTWPRWPSKTNARCTIYCFQGYRRYLAVGAADPEHLGAEIGFFLPSCTRGDKPLNFHPHLHCIVPGGGISPDGSRWVALPSRLLLPVNVLSRRFRSSSSAIWSKPTPQGSLQFYGDPAGTVRS